MKSVPSRMRRQARRQAARERVTMLLVSARLDGVPAKVIEKLKGQPELMVRRALDSYKNSVAWSNA